MEPDEPRGRAGGPALGPAVLIAGAVLAVLGVALVPLPGPGFLVLGVAAPVLVVGVVLLLAGRSTPSGGYLSGTLPCSLPRNTGKRGRIVPGGATTQRR